jgi:hypothetical protein
MNAYPALFVLLGFLNSGNPTDENTPFGKDERTSQVDETLRQELLRRMGEDQKARQAVLPFLEKLKIWDPAEIKKLDLPEVKKLNEIDRRNTARMKEIVNQHGWPGNALVGADGANAAWLLVQHADQDPGFQKQCLALMEKAIKQGQASAGDWAYLTDRVRIAEKKNQLYGTQLRQEGGKWSPLPIEDPSNVDRRRKGVGLSSLADYLKFVETTFKPKIEQKGK